MDKNNFPLFEKLGTIMRQNYHPLFLILGIILIGAGISLLLFNKNKTLLPAWLISMGLMIFCRYFVDVEYLERLDKTHPYIYFSLWFITIFLFATYFPALIQKLILLCFSQNISSQDMQAVFGTQKIKVTSLNNGEMEKTEGEWIPFAIRAGSYAWRLYRGWSQGSRFWYPIGFGWASRPAH